MSEYFFTNPVFNVTIKHKLPLKKLRSPDEAIGDRGVVAGNRTYQDLRMMTWDDFLSVSEAEREMITRITSCRTPFQMEILQRDIYSLSERILHLDPGVASTVVALSAAGCLTVSSCHGGAYERGHQETHPLVAAYVPYELIPFLMKTAKEMNVGLIHHIRQFCVVAYVRDIEVFPKFAQLIYDRRAEIASIQKRRSQ